jgi:hypothetical protein
MSGWLATRLSLPRHAADGTMLSFAGLIVPRRYSRSPGVHLHHRFHVHTAREVRASPPNTTSHLRHTSTNITLPILTCNVRRGVPPCVSGHATTIAEAPCHSTGRPTGVVRHSSGRRGCSVAGSVSPRRGVAARAGFAAAVGASCGGGSIGALPLPAAAAAAASGSGTPPADSSMSSSSGAACSTVQEA